MMVAAPAAVDFSSRQSEEQRAAEDAAPPEPQPISQEEYDRLVMGMEETAAAPPMKHRSARIRLTQRPRQRSRKWPRQSAGAGQVLENGADQLSAL